MVRSPQWSRADRALALLGRQVPVFDADASLLKVVAINSLYGTNVYATLRMARHVEQIMSRPGSAAKRPELVEELSALPAQAGEKPRRFHSFASKFAHLFFDADRLPIMDSYAVGMIKHHLGRAVAHDVERPYVAFVANVEELRTLAGLDRHEPRTGPVPLDRRATSSCPNLCLRKTDRPSVLD